MCRRFPFILLLVLQLQPGSALVAQQFVTPGINPQGTVSGGTQTLPYGGVPALRVAPDGAVHLDGPGAQWSQPAYAAQPGMQYGQAAPGGFGNRFADWLYNDPVPWQYNHRTGFFGDFMYLRPRNAEVAYALPIEGTVALGDEVPMGPVAIVDQEYEPGFRAGAVLRLTDGASIRGSYWFFRSESTDSAIAIDPNTPLRSLVIHPNTANAAVDIDTASARQDIDFDLVDIDYRGLILGCESCCDNRCAIVLNAVVGGRYANMEQEFRSNFADATGNTTVNTNVEFRGGGIRLGIESEHHATSTGFFVYGSGVSNLMVGEFTANYLQNNSVNGIEARSSWEAGRIVPTLDMELGLGWVGPRRRLKFSGGYLVSTWFNVVKTEDWINAVQTSNYDDMSGILTFDGLVARATWEF